MNDYRYVSAVSQPARVDVSIRKGEERIRLNLSEDEARTLRNDLTIELRCVRILNKARTAAYRDIYKMLRDARKK